MNKNDFFYVDDEKISHIGEFPLPGGWWSRPYEYNWANRYNTEGVIADMGAGYTYRPFTDMLSTLATKVYRVDSNEKLRDVPVKHPDKVKTIIANFTNRINDLNSQTFDRVFCISVLEDVGWKICLSLEEFKRILKDNGKIILTFDVPIRSDSVFPGVELEVFTSNVSDAGLKFLGNEPVMYPNKDKQLLVNNNFGLSCYHCILVKRS